MGIEKISEIQKFKKNVTATSFSEVSSSPSIISNEVDINLSIGSIFQIEMTDDISTFTITNIPVGVTTFMVMARQNASSAKIINWSFSGKTLNWSDNNPPTLTTTLGKMSIYSFLTINGDVWYGTTVGENYN